MNQLEVWTTYLRIVRMHVAAVRDEKGAMSAENVIWTAILAAGAITIATIIITKFTGEANNIPTGP
jgi:spore maturation protein SpmA